MTTIEHGKKAASASDESQELPFPLPPKFTSIDEEREFRKQQLAEGFRIFHDCGFSDGITGHITVRDPGETETFWVNPFGMPFNHITADDLVRCDHDGNIVEGKYHVNRALPVPECLARVWRC